MTDEEIRNRLEAFVHEIFYDIQSVEEAIALNKRLILSADYSDVFEKLAFSFGKVDASFVIRKSLGSLAPTI